MRQLIFGFIAIFLFSISVQGQTEDYRNDKIPQKKDFNKSETEAEVVSNSKDKAAKNMFKMGLRIGLSVGDVLNTTVDGGGDKVIHLGPVIGVVMNIALAEKVFLQPEVLIHSKGLKGRSTNFNFTQTFSLNLYYLEIPIIVKTYVGNKTVKGVFGTGPQFDIGLFAHEFATISGNGGSDSLSEFEKFPDPFSRFEFSWNADLGISIGDAHGFRAEITLRPMIAITPTIKDSDPVVRNFNVVASAALFFGK